MEPIFQNRFVIGDSPDPDAPDARISLDLHHGPGCDRLAFVFHGRNGSSDSPHLMRMIEPYLRRGYAVIAPNLCNSYWNDAAGTGADFTIGGHIRDCARVIEWTKSCAAELSLKAGRFALCGHSMGGYAACALAAGAYKQQAEHVFAVAPFTSGERMFDAREKYHPGGIGALAREVPMAMSEWPLHSIYRLAPGLSMPVSAAVGEQDNLTLPADVKDFFKALPNGVAFEVLAGEHHSPVGGAAADRLELMISRLEAASCPQTHPSVLPAPAPHV